MSREGETKRSRRPGRYVLLDDIITHGTKIHDAVREISEETFLSDELRYFAIAHLLLIVSEATTQLLANDPEIAENHPELPWVRIKGIGNVLRHAYRHVEPQLIWDTVNGKSLEQLMTFAKQELGIE